ncbi:hypothetical protein [Arcobacter sp. s6]|jgi:hypothetical protein|uniref:hypothetical protein n=1 Tax=Arcobacter sp. s6 TaxID=3230363 RepID=UPI0034A0A0D0
MKKSYTLFISIILITLFSFLAISILETKALRSSNLSNQYLYIQGKNHLEFFKKYIIDSDLKDITSLEIKDDFFNIIAKIEQKDSIFIINILVKAKDYDISLYEQIIKE